MAPVIDHTKYASKQEWLDSYPEWSLSGITIFVLHRIQHASATTQLNASLYVALNVFGPFILAYLFPSFIAPIIAMSIIFIGYNYVLPLWTPHEIEQDTSVNTAYVPTDKSDKHNIRHK